MRRPAAQRCEGENRPSPLLGELLQGQVVGNNERIRFGNLSFGSALFRLHQCHQIRAPALTFAAPGIIHESGQRFGAIETD